ncbi:MAG: glycosyltransferase family 2 protein [Elusimicrobiota bacterium]
MPYNLALAGFASLLAALVYTYLGYPALLLIFAKIEGIGPRRGNLVERRKDPARQRPLVTIIIPAYNEQANIRAKLENVLSLHYPKLEVIVVSDASTDKTDDIVREFAGKGVLLLRLEKRGGKVSGYRKAVARAQGHILVFSDATSQLEKDSLEILLSNFYDPTIGCVAGRLFFVADHTNVSSIGKGEEAYWNYNILINAAEAHLASLTSVSGAFFAVRKHLFPENLPVHLAEDFIVPLNVVRQGYRTILEPRAICREVAVHAETQEIRKRARITLQNIRGLLYGCDLLNVFRYGTFSLLLISHKALRLLTPLMLLGLFIANIVLLPSSILFAALLVAQLMFYSLGILSGWLGTHRPRLLNAVHFFCLSNYAIFLGILMFLGRTGSATWETERI